MNLLPCPFCGSSRLENLANPSGPVKCIDCGAAGPTNPRGFRVSIGIKLFTPEDAWNTRDGAAAPCSVLACEVDAECVVRGRALCSLHALRVLNGGLRL
jgi:hypothetical protein